MRKQVFNPRTLPPALATLVIRDTLGTQRFHTKRSVYAKDESAFQHGRTLIFITLHLAVQPSSLYIFL